MLALRRQYLTPGLITYYREPLLIVEGHMQYVWDETGKQYLDAFAGIVTVSVGHCHPKVVEKVREQVGKLQHTTTIYLHPDDRPVRQEAGRAHARRERTCRSATSPTPAARPTRSPSSSAREFTGQYGGHHPAQRLPRRHAGDDGADRARHLEVQAATRRVAVKNATPGYCYRCPYGLDVSELRRQVRPRRRGPDPLRDLRRGRPASSPSRSRGSAAR